MILILKSLLKAFWRDARGTILLVSAATLVGALAAIASPYLFSRAVDELAHGAGRAGVLGTLVLYALLFGVAKAFGQGARFLIVLCAERLSFIANTAFFARLLRKTPAFFLAHNAAEIGTARQQGTQTLNIVTQLGLGGILPGCVQIAFSVALLGHLVSWDIAAIVFAYGAVVVILDYVRIGRVKPALDAALDRSQANARLVGNAVAVIDTLRQTRGEAWIAGRFAGSAREALANWQRFALASSAFCGILGVAAALQLILTFLILVPRYEAGDISIGSIVLFNTLLIQLNEPFHLIGMGIKETVEAAARFRPLATMWAAPEAVEPADPVPYRTSLGDVAFDAVAFRYPNGRGVSALSFVARRGTPTFLTGETGSGKSTVLRLLLKELEPTEGRIRADGIDLGRVASADWFAHVGVVPQDLVLLNDSVSVNIVLGRPFDPERLRRAAAQASILARVEAMPEGFDTVVGERGLKLSGGERQRIAIARALYGEPAILVLDEASSALDADTERQIMDGLRDLADRLTIIAVTHRTAMIRPGDRTVRLEAS
ncbi:ABC transporter ATP-binding protein [Methylobacterium sp. NEAU 140]|uniref:ABC transporter ATP-binding protein n=1 Tax=Methylobacterium sp. NEAU 140 TaxID=3064945 RepID=UPI0027345A18|nr:ABC transporter ATP-binding protein [Methylobacterium sp. NEAU 140]MDP4023917.1 ABC transporter ATP-binding protein [Methylobacterium sp. NEAU 140]